MYLYIPMVTKSNFHFYYYVRTYQILSVDEILGAIKNIKVWTLFRLGLPRSNYHTVTHGPVRTYETKYILFIEIYTYVRICTTLSTE